MSRFYGEVHGAGKTAATRRGHTNSGLTVMARSYNGDIRVRFYDCDDEDWVYIAVHHHSGGHVLTLYDGPVTDLIDKNKHSVIVQNTIKAFAPDLLVA